MARVEIIQCDRCKATLVEGELCDSAVFIIGDASDDEGSTKVEFPDVCQKCSGAIKRLFNNFARDEVFPENELNARGGSKKTEGQQDGGGQNTAAETGGQGTADTRAGVETAGAAAPA